MESTRRELWCSLAHDPAERATILLLIVARRCRATRAVIARLNFARSTAAAQPAATSSKLMKKYYHCKSPGIRSENAGPSYSDFHMWLSLSFTVAKRNYDVDPMNTLNRGVDFINRLWCHVYLAHTLLHRSSATALVQRRRDKWWRAEVRCIEIWKGVQEAMLILQWQAVSLDCLLTQCKETIALDLSSILCISYIEKERAGIINFFLCGLTSLLALCIFPMPHKYFEVVLILNLTSSTNSLCQILIRIYVFIYSFPVLLFLEHVTFHVLRLQRKSYVDILNLGHWLIVAPLTTYSSYLFSSFRY